MSSFLCSVEIFAIVLHVSIANFKKVSDYIPSRSYPDQAGYSSMSHFRRLEGKLSRSLLTGNSTSRRCPTRDGKGTTYMLPVPTKIFLDPVHKRSNKKVLVSAQFKKSPPSMEYATVHSARENAADHTATLPYTDPCGNEAGFGGSNN